MGPAVESRASPSVLQRLKNLRMQALGSTSLLCSIWQQPSVENILGYISNNLNQLAKSTKFLLLCLALKFLQTWLNRQERVIKLNLWNKNRPFGTSHTHAAGVPKSLSFFHVSNCVVLPPHARALEQAQGSGHPSRHGVSSAEVGGTAKLSTLRAPSFYQTTPPRYHPSMPTVNFRDLRQHTFASGGSSKCCGLKGFYALRFSHSEIK